MVFTRPYLHARGQVSIRDFIPSKLKTELFYGCKVTLVVPVDITVKAFGVVYAGSAVQLLSVLWVILTVEISFGW